MLLFSVALFSCINKSEDCQFWRDSDGDGLGNPADMLITDCDPGSNYVDNDLDCNDSDPGSGGRGVVIQGASETRYETIQEAIDAAADGSVVEVGGCSAEGDFEERISLLNRSLTLLAPAGSEATVLDGGGLGSTVTVSGGAVTLEGFTIRNGAGTEYNEHVSGGGVFALEAELTLRGCEVTSNTARDGGGVFVEGGELSLESTQVSFNTADFGAGLEVIGGEVSLDDSSALLSNIAYTSGGGVYLWGGDWSGGVIRENSAEYGGGVYLDGSNGPMALSDVTIELNSASYGGGVGGGSAFEVTLEGVSVRSNSADFGGGMDSNPGSSVEADGSSLFSENTATNSGGGVYLWASDWSGGVFTVNTATFGGGMFADGTDGEAVHDYVIQSVEFSENYAEYFGGGLFTYDGAATLEDVVILDNSVTYQGAGLFSQYSGKVSQQATVEVDSRSVISGNYAANGGGGIYVDNSEVTLWGTSVTGNSAGTGGESEEGGGATLWETGVLISEGADWGRGASDNAPQDIRLYDAGRDYSFDGDAYFRCEAGGSCE
jgi:hypothetical protein